MQRFPTISCDPFNYFSQTTFLDIQVHLYTLESYTNASNMRRKGIFYAFSFKFLWLYKVWMNFFFV